MNATTNTADRPRLDPAAVREAVAAEVRAAVARDGRKPGHLADEVGISRTALSRKLRGLAPFHTEELLAISDALRIDPGRFVSVFAGGGQE